MGYKLREIERLDLICINKWRNDPVVIDLLRSPFRYINSDVDEDWYSDYINGRKNNIRLVIVDEANDAVVGAVYLTDIDWVARSAEFSVWVGDRSAQGNGAGKYATLSMLKHGFDDVGLNRVYLQVLVDNERALKLYRSVGFVAEGVLRQSVYKNGGFKDVLLMSVLASEYRTTHI